MQAQRGRRFPTSVIAKVFRVNSAVMRPLLDTLVREGAARSVVEGKFTVFWVPTEGELQAARNRADRLTAASVSRPLNGYQAMLNSHMQLCQLWRK